MQMPVLRRKIKPLPSAWIYRGLGLLLLLLFLSTPGNKSSFFTGFPLTAKAILWGSAAALVLWISPWWQHRFLRWLIPLTFLLLTSLQLWGSTSLPYGWSACFQRGPDNLHALSTPCEPSLEYKDGARTAILPRLEYSGRLSSPLYFMNDLINFNYFSDNPRNREHIQYGLQASSYLTGNSAATLRIRSTIAGTTIRINNQTHSLTPGVTKQLSLPLPVNQVEVRYLTYRQDDQALSVQLTQSEPFYQLKNNTLPSSAWVERFRVALYGLLLITTLLLAYAAWRPFRQLSLAQQAFLAASVLIALFLRRQPEITATAYTLLILVSGSFLAMSKKQTGFRAWLLFLLFLWSYLYVSKTVPPGSLEIFSGGNDPLTHEGLARLVYLAPDWKHFLQPWESGVYYYQPLYRYALAAFHALTGEAMWGPYLIQVFLIALTYVSMLNFIWKVGRTAGLAILSLLLFLYTTHPVVSPLFLALTPFQQSLATPLFLISIILLIQAVIEKEKRWWVYGGLGFLYGISLATRTDFFPSLGGIGVLSLWMLITWKPRRQTVILVAALLGGISFFSILVILRNYWIAQVATVFPTSAGVNQLTEFLWIVPYMNGPSMIKGSDIVFKVIRAYHGNYATLASILYNNYHRDLFLAQANYPFVWYNLPLVAGVGLLFGTVRSRWILLVLSSFFLPLFIITLFYSIHNGIAMLAHFILLSILIIAVAFSGLINKRENVLS